MKDQHTKIKGYRDLSQAEIDLMNEIKDHGSKTSDLLDKVSKLQTDNLRSDLYAASMTNLEYATLNLKQGQMWLVRAVALPEGF